MAKDLKKRAQARETLLRKSSVEARAEARRQLVKQASEKTNQQNLEDRARARLAWLQGGPGNNDPKELGYPGEIKYPRMEVPVGGDSRQWEQQWFEGAAEQTKQKMGPSGVELELKKKLQRASDDLRKLDKMAGDQLHAETVKAANELNSIIVELDRAGYTEAAQEADSVLEKIAEFLATKPVRKGSNIKQELVQFANLLDAEGLVEEANVVDEFLKGDK